MPQTDWGQTWLEYHELSDPCNHQRWCRLHWWPGFDESGHPTQLEYPFVVNVKSSRNGWQAMDVVCGPGAFLPKVARHYLKKTTLQADARLKEENSGITDDWQ